MKLVDLAHESVRILKESGESGIRSDILAEMLQTPKRRVYDVIAVLKALEMVSTTRRFDGTTIKWIDRSKEFVPRAKFEEDQHKLEEECRLRKELQVQVVELKEQLRITRSKLRRDARAVETVDKAEFNTSQLRIRALSSNGIKRVSNSGIEALVETHEPGMIVDPVEKPIDEKEALIRNLRRT